MHERLRLLLVVFAVAILAGACGQASQGGSEGSGGEKASAGYPVTVTDSLGRQVKISEEPEEVASMAPSVTETVYLVGAGEKVVGVTTADDYPPQVKKVETIGNYAQINAEKVASLGTDVLFLSYESTTEEQAGDLAKKTGAQTIVLNPTSVEEAIQTVGAVGEIVGEKEKAQKVEKRLRNQLEEVKSAVEDEPEPTVFYELGHDPLYTVGPGSFIQDAINIAGGKNVAADAKQPYPQYSVEKLIKDDPEYYLVGSSSGATVESVENRPGYGSLEAVRKEQVLVVNDALISRPGPRIVKGVRQIAETIHPDAFE